MSTTTEARLGASNLGDGPDLGKAARAEHAMTEAHAAELAARRRDEEAAASVDAGVTLAAIAALILIALGKGWL